MNKENIKKDLSDFTARVLFNDTSIYSHKDTENIINDYVDKAKDTKEFYNLIFNDRRLWNNQGFWLLVKEKADNYNSFVHRYMKDIADETFETVSDCGGLKIGNKGCSIILSNNYGDCNNTVYIVDKNVNIQCLDFNTTVEGEDINIYDYDCGDDIIKTLKGRYAIYSGDRIFIFVKGINF